MVVIDGEKWACDACVRGHRVSNCNHLDRPLQHINKKGRPVSQCHHCRAMRKSRASHIKCDCGEKTHKCIHLQSPLEGHRESCCCNHGGRCTCSHKKEHTQLNTVPESDSDVGVTSQSPQPKSVKASCRTRRRANTVSSDIGLSFDENGRRRPTHRHNKASQKSGPYQLNRANSLHTPGSAGKSSVDIVASRTMPGESRGNSPSSSVSLGQDHRRSRSEEASPLMTSPTSFTKINGSMPPPLSLDLSSIKYQPYVPNCADFFGSMSDNEQPIFSAGLSAGSVDWSGYDIDYANKTADFAPSSYSQAHSYGFDFNGSDPIPSTTAATSASGEVSEVEDYHPATFDDFEVDARYGSSVTGSGYATLLGSNELPGLDYNGFREKSCGSSQPTLLADSGTGSFTSCEDEPSFWADYNSLPSITL